MVQEASTSKAGRGGKGKDPANMPWVEKYRPNTLDEVAAHKEIIETIKKLTSEGKLPHLLLYGPPGTGKTSTVLAIAKALYGSASPTMSLELNASDDRGIAVVRNEVQDFASTRSVFTQKFKLIILDECDAMTKDAQFALRRIIEKYASISVCGGKGWAIEIVSVHHRNARFCLICNHVNKIIPALQSRCTRFRFPPLPEQFVRARLTEICQLESITPNEDGINAVCKLGNGDMRQTLNILQSTYMSAGAITVEAAYLCTGNPMPQQIEHITSWLLNDDMHDAYDKLTRLQMEKGFALIDIIRELHPWLFAIELPAEVRLKLVIALADIEHNMSVGTNPRLQLAGVVGAFATARDGIIAASKA